MRLPLGALIVVMLVGCGPSAKVGRAARNLDRFAEGDREAIHKAHRAVESALSSDRTSAETWTTRGRVFLVYLTHPDLDPPTPEQRAAQEATLSFEKAAALKPAGSTHADLSEHLPELQGTLTAQLVNEVESNRLEQAEGTLDLALRAHAAGERVGGRAALDGTRLHTLAVEVLAATGRAAEAAEHYGALHDQTQAHDAALAAHVARAYAASDVSAGLAFVEPIARGAPADEALLRTVVTLLVQDGRPDDAASRVLDATELLETSPSGAFLAGVLFEQAGHSTRARQSFSRALELDDSHVEAHLELGRSLARLARDVQRRVESSDNAQSPMADEELVLMADDLDDLWEDAATHLQRAHELAPGDADPLRLLVRMYDDKLGDVEIERLRGWRKRAYRADIDRRDTASAALKALEATP
ncbi:MAG: hypothetical protein KTR31_41025 [Myxococcales bacterium]|nr:hypothetical protein [Myxococcales bacterium]